MPSFWPFQETTNPAEIPVSQDKIRKYPTAEVQIYTSPWVSGTRAVAYFGPVSVTAKHTSDWESTIQLALETIQDTTSSLGGNAIVGIEIAIDPFAEPPTLIIIGTAAELVPLF